MGRLLFHGPPGLGKTTLAVIIAAEMDGSLRELAAPSIQKSGDLATVLTVLGYGDILFLDEIHRMKAEIAEILYAAMEDFKVSLQVTKGEKPMTIHLDRFTLVGATTDYGTLPGPLRDRFGQVFPTRMKMPGPAKREVKVIDPGFEHPRLAHNPQSMYDAQMAYFFDCIREGRTPVPGGVEGVINMKVVDAAYQSAQVGQVVKVS